MTPKRTRRKETLAKRPTLISLRLTLTGYVLSKSTASIKLYSSIKLDSESRLVCRSVERGVPMNRIKLLRHLPVTNGIGASRTFAVGGKAKKGKGAAASDAPKQSTLSREVKSTTVVGANILKDGIDPKILPDSEYPEWLWHLLDKKPALSELRRKNIETLPYEDLKRFVKLDNRARIKENNTTKAKN